MRDPDDDGSVDESAHQDGLDEPGSSEVNVVAGDDAPAQAQAGASVVTATAADVLDEPNAGWQSPEHRAKSDPMRILPEYETTMSTMAVEALRNVLAEHPRATAANLRELVAAHPSLGKVTLAELFGGGDESAARVGRSQTPASNGWADQFARVLGRQTKKKHTYDSMHELVDRFYLRTVLDEHKSITATARHLKVTRVRLRTRLQALGLYDGSED